MRRHRALAATALAASALVAGGCAATAPEPTTTPVAVTETPRSAPAVGAMAVVGDSITLGVSACGSQEACPQASWAVGSEPEVDSIVQRINDELGANPRATPIARLGAGVDYGVDSVDLIASTGADLVLILLGANDACKPTVDEVTPPAEFAAQYSAMLTGIAEALPDTRIVALSVPDVLRLWELGRTDPETVAMWGASPSCRSLLAEADSDATADVERRAAIEETVDAYDAAIIAACDAVEQCTSDDGAVHAVRFEVEHVSAIDSFHPSIAGQAALADAAWPVVASAISP
ncbi:SGNH/GDSL hydrolase family protein [Microbacterium thalassium]|uniref:Lysophospholipase L1-like esterase n=1 Tax=Microbacterium thalassium TaxID=362649 RepID=A0A7X0FNF6_9MICO|nr:SGNH/GDSL hydrolase family protein [Microbacterium thalassium]MBB6390265.1 lysophospholipase L1-like esterase [Microbacterium thalassium]GLK25374.1 lipoprotein [Microbacterium thalassium]